MQNDDYDKRYGYKRNKTFNPIPAVVFLHNSKSIGLRNCTSFAKRLLQIICKQPVKGNFQIFSFS